MEETIAGPASNIASHCASKSGKAILPASGGTWGPQLARKLRTAASALASRLGGGSGIHRLNWNPPLVPARTSAAQARIACGCIISAPQPPRPPALAMAMASEAGQALAIGAIKIGARKLNCSQNVAADEGGVLEHAGDFSSCHLLIARRCGSAISAWHADHWGEFCSPHRRIHTRLAGSHGHGGNCTGRRREG